MKKTERSSENLENFDQDHFERLQEGLAAWKEHTV